MGGLIALTAFIYVIIAYVLVNIFGEFKGPRK